MWRYEQDTGLMYHNDKIVGQGYSGSKSRGGLNNPEMQDVKNVGPIPRGTWIIGPPYFSDEHGPFAMPLTCKQWTPRSGFLIHGDSIQHPGDASEGCIIMPREVRMQVWDSGDQDLEVFYVPREVV